MQIVILIEKHQQRQFGSVCPDFAGGVGNDAIKFAKADSLGVQPAGHEADQPESSSRAREFDSASFLLI